MQSDPGMQYFMQHGSPPNEEQASFKNEAEGQEGKQQARVPPLLIKENNDHITYQSNKHAPVFNAIKPKINVLSPTSTLSMQHIQHPNNFRSPIAASSFTLSNIVPKCNNLPKQPHPNDYSLPD